MRPRHTQMKPQSEAGVALPELPETRRQATGLSEVSHRHLTATASAETALRAKQDGTEEAF